MDITQPDFGSYGQDIDIDTEAGGFWFGLIDEKEAANFIGLVDRTLQQFRQKGDGPKFVRISSRCIRYRRIDLRAWAEDRLRTSTADMGAEHAAA
ncbi:MAG: helix-turn-helix domain-containing protein [Rhodospirillales bacterium]|jgi:predicted DNA-binding transcriptional regulator AlpA|nr:helix-turn-helix domain-containing protein [Rhodospirillales bacterium]